MNFFYRQSLIASGLKVEDVFEDEERGWTAVITSDMGAVDGNVMDVYGETEAEARAMATYLVSILSKSTGAHAISLERLRQIVVENFTAEHDDAHDDESLALAAAYYALPEDLAGLLRGLWPWHESWNKKAKRDRFRQLEIAGALLAAEFDRLWREEERRSRDFLLQRGEFQVQVQGQGANDE